MKTVEAVEALFDPIERRWTWAWIVPAPGDERIRVTLEASHRKDAKQYHAWLSRCREERLASGYVVRKFAVEPGEGMTIDRAHVARYSQKSLEVFAFGALKALEGYMAGHGNADIGDRVRSLMAGHNYLTGE